MHRTFILLGIRGSHQEVTGGYPGQIWQQYLHLS
jgi:hypothetical protein